MYENVVIVCARICRGCLGLGAYGKMVNNPNYTGFRGQNNTG